MDERKRLVESHRDLKCYKRAVELAMKIFAASKSFPREETYSLTDQIRRSSRSVAANIAEAWRKRRYEAAFIAKLSDAEAESAETQCWLELTTRCKYLQTTEAKHLHAAYDELLRMIVNMIHNSQKWTSSLRKH